MATMTSIEKRGRHSWVVIAHPFFSDSGVVHSIHKTEGKARVTARLLKHVGYFPGGKAAC